MFSRPANTYQTNHNTANCNTADLSPRYVVIQKCPCAVDFGEVSKIKGRRSRVDCVWSLLRGSDNDHLTDTMILYALNFTINRFSQSMKVIHLEVSISQCLH